MPTATHMPRLSVAEVFGLTPPRQRLKETLFMLRGDPYTPKSRFGLTSLKVLLPGLSIRTYLGMRRSDGRVPISNLVNHTPTPIADGWSVRVTQVQDFRGGALTYDSHNGTDFVVPPGTVVVTAAPGTVIRVSSEFHRGGLKVFVDHGGGMVTTYNHLGRALVAPGEQVVRGQPIALSGSSGVDCVLAFPWSAPHVHFNVWLNGHNVDPFAVGDETSLWLCGNDPRPHSGDTSDTEPETETTDWDDDAVAKAIDSCLDPELASRLCSEGSGASRAADLLFYLNYFPTRFRGTQHLYRVMHERRALLDLPFRPADFSGVWFADQGKI